MGNPSVARRHPDYPVEINGTFAKRVQSVDLTKTIPTNPTDELGNFAHAGIDQDTTQYSGNLTWFPLDASVENLFCQSTGSVVTLNMFTTQNGVNIKTPVLTYGGATVIGLEYSCQAQQEWRATARLKGTTWSEGSNTISATAPSGVGAYRSKNVKVAVGATTGVRVAGVTARADLPSQELYELNNINPVGTNYDSPTVTVDIDFWESTMIAGNVVPTLDSPQNIVITVHDDALVTKQVVTCTNMVGGTESMRGTVRGWATRRYSYTGKGDSTTGGMTIGNT